MISFTINTISIGKGKWIGVFLERGEPNIVQVFERISNNPQSVTDEDCITLYTGAYGESWSPRCLLVSVDLLAALGAIRAAQRQSAKNF